MLICEELEHLFYNLELNIPMDSRELAKYIEETDGISKPWLLLQLRLKKLEERKSDIPQAQYIQELEELHNALMGMGEWWRGQEEDVFKP